MVALDAPVWKALADDSRRRILDLLRERPRTTGELAEEFAFSRFAVMKHLKLLTDAGLVLVRRSGRERWNHLNAVPIQRIYRRWIRPFDAMPADQLLAIQRAAEEEPEMAATDKAMRAHRVELEVHIAAKPERVWKVLTDEIHTWWHASMFCGPAPRRFTLDARVGGQWIEDWGDGQGVQWGTVIECTKNQKLSTASDLVPAFGGPARTLGTFELVADGDGTLLKRSEHIYGFLAPDAGKGMTEGWKLLLEECLKPRIEDGKEIEVPATLDA